MADITYARIRTKDGTALVATRGDTVVASCLPRKDVSAEEQRLLERFPGAKKVASTKVPAARALQDWWRGKDPGVERIPVDLSGQPAFRAKVYRALRRVKPGKTVTYKDLATRAGSPRAVRAVGGAMAQNPLAPFVPCHRVMGSGGSLTGYTAEGGTSLKRRLLEMEGAPIRANP